MAENKMPARIWSGPELVAATRTWGMHEYSEKIHASVPYIRADLVEPLVEALRTAIRVADEAREEWDSAPSGMKAGKLLIALSDPSLKYRADITAIHAALSSWEAGQ